MNKGEEFWPKVHKYCVERNGYTGIWPDTKSTAAIRFGRIFPRML